MEWSDCRTEDDRRACALAHNAAELAEQGLPAQIADPGTLERLARIVATPLRDAA